MSERVDEFADSVEALESFGSMLTGLIEELLRHHGIPFHSVGYRVKARESAERKMQAREKYAGYSDLTDLLGVRVITYFSDDVDTVSAALTPEFSIDHANSVDKRKQMGADRFGYMSMHFVAELNDKRAKLPEHSRFKGLRFELQIRSILQHAWAEIEHDLGYKSDVTLPQQFKRRFSLLAGQLEMADEEFVRLRNDRGEYEATMVRELRDSPSAVEVNQASIAQFIDNSEFVRELDGRIAEIEGIRFKEGAGVTFAASRAADLVALGVGKISDLIAIMEERADEVVRFATAWESTKVGKGLLVPRGSSVTFLAYLLLSEMESAPPEMAREKRDLSTLYARALQAREAME